MIDGLKPYATMKDSGVECLEEVPDHWEVQQLGRLGTLLKGNGGSKDDEVKHGISCIRYGDLYTTHQHFIKGSRSFISEDSACKYTAIQFGDILFAASGETIPEIGKSAANLISSNARCGGDIILFRPVREFDARFLGYLLDCRPIADQKAVMGRGITVMHIYGAQLKYLSLPLPPPSEQTTIARFLDHVNSQIDSYIRAKERLITFLEEQKQVLIHGAVTGRINVRTGQPYPAYKPSGVEWLNEVPAHWQVQRLKTLCRMKSGEAITGMSIEPVGQYPVYGGNGVRGFAKQYTHAGQHVLIGRQGALCGNIHIACGKFWASEHAVVATLHVGYVLNWFSAVLRVMNLNQYSVAAAQPGLAVERVLNLGIPVPDPEEQAMIAENIELRTAVDEAVIARAHREIALFREYRARLIADVVTGKLDVRSAAAELPESQPVMDDGRVDAVQAEAGLRIAERSIAQEASR